MPHIIFIHGIDNKPAVNELLAHWREALAKDNGLDLASLNVTSQMVYWADVLYPTPLTEGVEEAIEPSIDDQSVAQLGAALSNSPEEAAFISGLAGKFTAVAL